MTPCRTFRIGVLCLAVLAGGAGCGVKGPASKAPPPVEMSKTFSQSGDAPVVRKWWLSFADERLGALMDQALSDNPGLQGTWSRLAQAEASARRAGAGQKPALTGEGSAARRRTDTPRSATYATDLSLGLAVSYELDLWGRIRSQRDAAEMELQATREDLDAAAITLTANVADTWCRLLDSAAQIKLIDEQISTNTKYLEIVSLRARKGQAQLKAIAALQQQQQLEATRSQRVQAQLSREVLTHGLAVLLGKAPTGPLSGIDGVLPPLPPLPRTGLPAELVTRRPDIRAAALRLAGANHTLGAAVADRFPRISLVARAETSGPKAHDLFDNWVGSLAGNLTAPLLDGGLRTAEVDRSRAAAEQALHNYAQAVLAALQEVEDALARERRQNEYLAHLTVQLDLSGKVVEQSRQHHFKGSMSYLHVLDALRSNQSLQRRVLTAKLDLIRNRISLYRALGGGWDLERPARSAGGATTKPSTGGQDDDAGATRQTP